MNERSHAYRFASEALRLAANPKFLAPCVAGAFMLIVGTILSIEYSLNMAAVLFAVPVASYALASVSLRGLTVTRRPVSTAVEGRLLDLSLDITSTGVTPRLSVGVTDTLPPSVVRESSDALHAALCAEDSLTMNYSVRPTKRGVYTIGPVHVTSRDPIGIFDYRRTYGQKAELVVYPRPEPVRLRMFLGTESLRPGEVQTTGKKGQGMELHGVRDYAPGDDLRRVHWKTTARRGSLVVTEFERGIASSVVIALENRAGTELPGANGSSLDVQTRVAAFVAESVLRLGLKVRLALADGGGVSTYAAASPEQLGQVLYPLAQVAANSDLGLAEILESADLADEQTFVLITSVVNDALVRGVIDMVGGGARVNVVLVPGAETAPSKPIQALEATGVEVCVMSGVDSHG